MSSSASTLFIGLMSGTSMDGVDGLVCDFAQPIPDVIACAHIPFSPEFRGQLLALQNPQHNELHQSALLANQLADRYAVLVQQLLEMSQCPAAAIHAIGCHGQTIRHNPGSAYSIQIGNCARLAEQTGIAVIGDFRSRDIAAGGQGAPLVPAFHQAVFGQKNQNIVVANIGGMANLTRLHPSAPVTGFDCGPGNVWMDAWIHLHQGCAYDTNGDWASAGVVIPDLLNQLLKNPYFAQQPPKSCGREQFSWAELLASVQRICPPARPADVQATLLELTARSISDAIVEHCPKTDRVLLCGGGANNRALRDRLAFLCQPARVETTRSVGFDVDLVEAMAFAWLAYQHTQGAPGNLPGVTGAKGPRILGAYYPA